MSVLRLHRCAEHIIGPVAGSVSRTYFVKLLKKSIQRHRKISTSHNTLLSTSHPTFGLRQADVSILNTHTRLLSTSHPVFGKEKAFSSHRVFAGPIGLSGFFFSIDPNFACGSKSTMNPNAYVTIRDSKYNRSRTRYQCYLVLSGGLKVEALIRTQVGWISPVVKLTSVPHVIHLGRGIDVSMPFVFHFTMVSILDELGDNTGSFLYFSGTPWIGFSAGFSRVQGGKLVLNPSKMLDPGKDRHDFIGQSGVHTPPGVSYNVARMKRWPVQQVPDNFKFTNEQRFRAKSLTRDCGSIPRNFVLSVLYRHQPCEVSSLWQHCVQDPSIVLDSKHHLRCVLHQARAEGFISFEMDPVTQRWVCHLTRERFEEVRAIVAAKASAMETNTSLRGYSATETGVLSSRFQDMSKEMKKSHLRHLSEQVGKTTEHLRRFQRTEIDYLPYTDLNGKVNCMWWYETVDVTHKDNAVKALQDSQAPQQPLL